MRRLREAPTWLHVVVPAVAIALVAGVFGTAVRNGSSEAEVDTPVGPPRVMLAFSTDADAGLYVMDAYGGQTVRITDFGSEPSWSPDGTKIAFTGKDGIYVAYADGRPSARLTADGYTPEWSPDSTRIAYTGPRAGSESWGLFVMNADGSDPEWLTESDSSSRISWSPNGTQLAYAWTGPPGIMGNIWLIDVAGRNSHLVVPHGWDPDFSPDGSRIVFRKNFTMPGQIRVVNVDGTNETSFDVSGHSPRWSPGGTTIAFDYAPIPGQRFLTGGCGIAFMNSDGSELRRAMSTDGCTTGAAWGMSTAPWTPVAPG